MRVFLDGQPRRQDLLAEHQQKSGFAVDATLTAFNQMESRTARWGHFGANSTGAFMVGITRRETRQRAAAHSAPPTRCA